MNRCTSTVTAILLGLLLSACSNIKETKRPPTKFNSFASMAPSNTELIYSLQAENRLKAVCNQCDYPAAAKAKPQTGSFLSIDAERLASLHPDGVFLLQEQAAIAHVIAKQGIAPVLLKNSKVSDVAANLRTIGKYCNKQSKAEELAAAFEKSIDDIKKQVAHAAKRPRVFFCVWPEPLITVGQESYLSDAVTICGGENLAAGLTQAYPHFSSERLLIEQPDIIILPDEARPQSFLSRPPWTSLNAVREHKVFYLPPRNADRLSRPTLRLTQGLNWLVQRLHPELPRQKYN